jgi:hypothetical protein
MNPQSSQPREVNMVPRSHALIVTLTLSALLGFGHGPAEAADSTHVDAATQQVERGAAQIGQGQVLVGAGQLAMGIGNTVVEGAKYSGQKLAEAGRAAEPDAKTAWQHTREGAVAFGSSVRDFFVKLFGG